MKHRIAWLAAILLPSVATAQDAPIDLAVEIIEERQDPILADYGRLYYPADDPDHVMAVEIIRQYTAMLHTEAEARGREVTSLKTCRSHAITMGLQAAQQSGSYDAYRADLDNALAWHAELIAENSERAREAAAIEQTQLASDLAYRAHWDQAWRQNFGLLFRNGMPQGGPDFIKINMAMAEICRRDIDNLDFIEGVLSEIDWPSISTHGEATDQRAWVIVQHAPLALQIEILPRLERLWEVGDTNPGNYAMLHDRVMTGQGRLQRYGSQFQCQDGRWVMMPTEDLDTLDARRAEMGMSTVSENAARFEGRSC